MSPRKASSLSFRQNVCYLILFELRAWLLAREVGPEQIIFWLLIFFNVLVRYKSFFIVEEINTTRFWRLHACHVIWLEVLFVSIFIQPPGIIQSQHAKDVGCSSGGILKQKSLHNKRIKGKLKEIWNIVMLSCIFELLIFCYLFCMAWPVNQPQFIKQER